MKNLKIQTDPLPNLLILGCWTHFRPMGFCLRALRLRKRNPTDIYFSWVLGFASLRSACLEPAFFLSFWIQMLSNPCTQLVMRVEALSQFRADNRGPSLVTAQASQLVSRTSSG